MRSQSPRRWSVGWLIGELVGGMKYLMGMDALEIFRACKPLTC